MKNVILLVFTLFCISSCGLWGTGTKPYGGDSSQNSLDWAGTYFGTVPCADCEGIQKNITINQNNTYTMQSVYLGKSTTPFVQRGFLRWEDNGRKILLKSDNRNDEPVRFQVVENGLYMLDQSGNRIQGALAENYLLLKGR